MKSKNYNYWKIKLIVSFVPFILFSGMLGCSDHNNEPETTEKQSTNKVSVGKPEEDFLMKDEEAIKVAVDKAKELKYDVDKMDIKIEKSDTIISIYLSPKQNENNTVTLGGDITIKIDKKTRKIVEIKRWQ